MSKILMLLLAVLSIISCKETEPEPASEDILGYKLLSDITGHWIGENETSFGTYDWFSFDFRPISASHVHSIYEGAAQQNIITSIFIADHEGRKQIMARNGGWLYGQYRATYFVLDMAEETANGTFYRLVDAVGGEDRAYIEFRFQNGVFSFDAYKDNSGSLDAPVHHMGFTGTNMNPSYSEDAIVAFNFPQPVSEVNLNNAFTSLIDPDTAMFLEEANDPFPKSDHAHISDLTISIAKDNSISSEALLLYISKESLVNESGEVDVENINSQVIRTIDISDTESEYTATYLHPDTYYITAFYDADENFYPSSSDISSVSKVVTVAPDAHPTVAIDVSISIP